MAAGNTDTQHLGYLADAFIQSGSKRVHTHSDTDSGVNHAGRQPAH